MTREAFIRELNKNNYSYKIQAGRIVVTQDGSVWLSYLRDLPSGVEFRNGANLNLEGLKVLPSETKFNNKRYIWLSSLASLPSKIVFMEGQNHDVHLGSFTGGWFSEWNGNIEGIDSNRLLNKMIKDGLFER